MEIKKELSSEEFEQLITAFKEEVHNNADLDFLARTLDIYIREITPAKKTYLFHLKDEIHLETIHNENKTLIDLSTSRGMLKRCIQTKEPQLTNDIKRDSNYEEDTDNIFSYNLKNLLIMPLYDINKNIFALMWIGIPKKDINQFIAEDLAHVQTLIDQISYVTPLDTIKEESPEDEEVTSGSIKGTEKNKEHIMADSPQKNHNKKVEAPALIKKIKSFFYKSENKKA